MSTRRMYLFIIAVLFLGLSAYLFTIFLTYHEIEVDADGWRMNDPAMNALPIGDVSVFIFGITYGSMILYAILSFRQRYFVTRLMFSYGLLLLVRIVTLTLIPLKEPDTLVYLADPFLNNLIYPGDIDADLFFSGHTGLLFVLYFISRKWIFAILGIVLGFLLMVQRVHYSIDIIAAIPFAYLIVRSVNLLLNKVGNDD